MYNRKKPHWSTRIIAGTIVTASWLVICGFAGVVIGGSYRMFMLGWRLVA